MNTRAYIDPEIRLKQIETYKHLRAEFPDDRRDNLVEMARRIVHASMLWDWQVFKTYYNERFELTKKSLDKDGNVC